MALARAMVKKPKVFLMDEPLSNLDAKLRNQMRTDLIELHKKLGTTFVYVTHDQVEAMSMGTNIVLMNQGKIMQMASPAKIYHEPDNLFTAKFIGNPTMNIFDSQNIGDLIDMPKATKKIGFRPSKVRLLEDDELAQKDELIASGPILTREFLGSEIIYRMQAPFGIISFKTFNEKQIAENKVVKVAVKHQKIYFFDEADRRIIA